MKYKNIFWGIVLIAIGVMFILKNMDVINFNWVMLFQLWPLLLIFWGISLIPVKDYIKFILMLVSLVIGLWLVNYYKSDIYFGWHFNKNDKEKWTEQNISESYDSTITHATLKMDAVAGNFKIMGKTDKLIDFESKGNIGDYKMLVSNEDSNKVVKIGLETNVIRINNKDKGNDTRILLNSNPIWTLKFEAGASDVDFDLTDFKIEKIKFEGGASSIKLKVGNKLSLLNIDIEAGASSIKISIPKESGCEFRGDNVLSSLHVENFTKINDVYRTADFEKAANKIYLNIDAAVSKLSIERY
jgi:hypothetical protein